MLKNKHKGISFFYTFLVAALLIGQIFDFFSMDRMAFYLLVLLILIPYLSDIVKILVSKIEEVEKVRWGDKEVEMKLQKAQEALDNVSPTKRVMRRGEKRFLEVFQSSLSSAQKHDFFILNIENEILRDLRKISELFDLKIEMTQENITSFLVPRIKALLGNEFVGFVSIFSEPPTTSEQVFMKLKLFETDFKILALIEDRLEKSKK